ncbi:hypothetical protein GGI11_003917 [Coemansia sp. RSA 2049]|nr:hypothetical protein GGI11_003917 [Coemansia sp. RSA 2049]
MSLSKLLLDKYGPEPLSRSFRAPFKSIVEKRIINASAEIRKDPDWTKHLSSKEKRQSWAETSAEKFNTTPGDMDFIFNELEYYKILQENTPQNMVLGGADMVWCKDIPADDSLTLELKQYAVVLEAAVSDLGYDDAWNAWEEGIVYTEPEPKRFAKIDQPLLPSPAYSLRGEELQVVVEMDTTYLAPKSPKKSPKIGPKRIRGDWKNSGIPSDKIVATAIWYYDVENAEISDIQFRDPVGTYEEHDKLSDILKKQFLNTFMG